MKEVYNDNFAAMGTRFGMVLPDVTCDTGSTVSLLIREEINRLENKISRFIPASTVSNLNRTASKYPVEVDEEMWRILIESRNLSKDTFGAFNIALKSLADYWNFTEADNNYSACGDSKFDFLLSSVGMDKIELDEQNHTVLFKNNCLEIDLGAIGKGLALRNINSILMENGIERAFISFGESSILALGSHPNGGKWKIGIPEPMNRMSNTYTFELSNCSVSTSGNTSNNRIAGRVNIINPFTGLPVKESKTILVADKNPVLAEVFSTSFMILDDDRIKEVLDNYPDTVAVKIKYVNDGCAEITEYNERILI